MTEFRLDEMAMNAVWILVADRARARLFSADIDGKSLTEIEDFVNPTARQPDRAVSRDRPPRSFESVGGARHAIESRTTATEKTEQQFARTLSAVLEQGRVAHRLQRLVLVAPPHFLGVLEQSLDKHVLSLVTSTIDKDLTLLTIKELTPLLLPYAAAFGNARKRGVLT